MVIRRRREFNEAITVGRCHIQRSDDRYNANAVASNEHVIIQVDTDAGDGDEDEDDSVDEDSDDDETDSIQDHSGVSESPLLESEHPEFDPNFQPSLPVDIRTGKPTPPRTALWRMNLTALSQRYNLYFVAYEGHIYVYRPRDAVRNTLPTNPDYVLKPPPKGPNYAGHIDPRGHQANNVVVGDLGDEEVLALTFDNGNVIAYNIKSIASHIAALERDPRSWSGRAPQPFFHQSVQISAWGLALHKKSRLIAVSCNFRTIVVFYPALHSERHSAQGSGAPGSSDAEFPDVQIAEFPPPNFNNVGAGGQTLLRDNDIGRRRNYRVIFTPTQDARNIPSVTFTSFPDGTADRVVGIDINGKIWFFSVWVQKIPIHIIPYNYGVTDDEEEYCRGWGVLLLPNSSFLPVSNGKEIFGAKLDSDVISLRNQPVIGWDISSTITHIPDNLLAPTSVRGAVDELNTSSDESDFEIGNEEINHNDNGATSPSPQFPPALPLTNHYFLSTTDRFTWSPKRPAQRLSSWPNNHNSTSEDTYSIFRVGLYRMELQNLRPDGNGVLANGALRPPFLLRDPMRHIWAGEDRMNKLIHIPELSLVVVGTIWGYIALIRLTQASSSDAQRGFRVEWTLPRRSDTKMKNMAPMAPFGTPLGTLKLTISLWSNRLKVACLRNHPRIGGRRIPDDGDMVGENWKRRLGSSSEEISRDFDGRLDGRLDGIEIGGN
ncbi:hypothetical protein MKZ38_002809 [Zalerion maritima]|uniref:Uncharacterized protein n=1 Tax=Zalerion maritima TaxID=339359 RepID=A0AAD5RV12_9PEZI|nr:hypothetical protein MKZ38_002809 [Zalerion maritima]